MTHKIVTPGLRIKTAFIMLDNRSLFIADQHRRARKGNAFGVLVEPIPGCCGDAWSVDHGGPDVAVYWLSEMAMLDDLPEVEMQDDENEADDD